jgi:type IX secretion system PorP/SprF family membrane protein
LNVFLKNISFLLKTLCANQDICRCIRNNTQTNIIHYSPSINKSMAKHFQILIFVLTGLCITTIQAQDPIFSQYYATPLQINPAFAGSAFAPRFGIAYRTQWQGFSGAYRTYAVFYEQRLNKLNSGVGFHLEGDDAGNGIFKTNRFSAHYSYRLMINKKTGVKIGVEAGAFQSRLNWDKLIFPDQIDAIGGISEPTFEIRPDQLTVTRLDLSSGLLIFGENFWAGFAMKHLNTPNETLLLVNNNLARGLPLRYTLHGGMDITLRKGNKQQAEAFISPNFLFVSQGPYQQINGGAYAGLGSFFAGTWIRHTFDQNVDAAIILLGFKYDIYKIGFTMDATLSRFSKVSGGTYEVTMSFLLDQNKNLKRKNARADTSECPKFFR